MKKWEIISSKIALDEKWLRVRKDKVKLPSGKIIDNYFVWTAPNICMLVAITKDNKFVVEKQYRHAAGKFVIAFPAGNIEEDEGPKKSALRELEEETGYKSKKIELLGKLSQDPAKKTSMLYIYLAREATPTGQNKFDAIENIETMLLSYKELLGLFTAGKLFSASSLSALFLLKEKFPELCK